MSFYPIVKFNDVDLNKIILSDPKIGKYTYTKKDENNDVLIKCSFESYELNYAYDRIGVDKFFLLTNFLLLEKPTYFKSNCDAGNTNGEMNNNIKNIAFLLSQNEKLNDFFNNLLRHLESKLKEKYNCQIIQEIPINKNNQIKILLNKFNNNVTTIIHHHKSKKNGGGLTKLCKLPINNFMSELKKELNLFKSKSYGQIVDSKINCGHDDNKIKISYSGKFILSVRCILTKEEQYCSNKIVDTKYKLKLTLHAKEIETKFTSSKITSILDSETTKLITEKKPTFTLIL